MCGYKNTWCPSLPWTLLLGLDLTSLDKYAEVFVVNPHSDILEQRDVMERTWVRGF